MPMYYTVDRTGDVYMKPVPLTIDEIRQPRDAEADYPPVYAVFRTREDAVAAAVRLMNQSRDAILNGPRDTRDRIGAADYAEIRGPYTAEDMGVYGYRIGHEWYDDRCVIVCPE